MASTNPLDDPDMLITVLTHAAALPNLQAVSRLQEVCRFWRDTMRGQLDVLLSAVAEREDVTVGDLSKCLVIKPDDTIKLLKEDTGSRTQAERRLIRLDKAKVQTVFTHDWAAVQQIVQRKAMLKRARDEAQRANAYSRFGGGSSSSSSAPPREVGGRSMRARQQIDYAAENVLDVEHVGSATAPAPAGNAAAPLVPGQLGGPKSEATLAAIAAWKLRLAARGKRLLEMGFVSEKSARFHVGDEVTVTKTGRVYLVQAVQADGSRVNVLEVPAERFYGGDGYNDQRFASRNGTTGLALDSAHLELLRPPSHLQPVPIVCTLARVHVDQQPSKFTPSASELTAALGRWPVTCSGGVKPLAAPCGVEWTFTPSACSWAAIYGGAAATLIPKVASPYLGQAAYRPDPISRDAWQVSGLSGNRKWGNQLEVAADLTPAEVVRAYVAACARGDASFHLEWSQAFSLEPNRSPPVCYGGDARVILADGAVKLARELAVGDAVGAHGRVVAIWRADVGRRIKMVTLGGAVLTPDHPVEHPDAGASRGWVRADALGAPDELFVDALFNFVVSGPSRALLLETEADERPLVASTLGQTLPAFEEPFWGTQAVVEHMQAQPSWPLVQTSC